MILNTKLTWYSYVVEREKWKSRAEKNNNRGQFWMYGDDAICSSSCLPTLPSSKRYHQQNNINNLDFQNKSIHYLLVNPNAFIISSDHWFARADKGTFCSKCQLKIYSTHCLQIVPCFWALCSLHWLVI